MTSRSPSAAAIPTAGSADMPISYLFLPPSPSCRKFHSIVPLCRKFHSSPRPSAFLLATFCPTQKRWFYRNVEHSFMPWKTRFVNSGREAPNCEQN
ncbi:hypothetical protein AVEN_88936-1 [Araneus ventricosus]|uniref:Uncharacterized protein n=1 Tax=Araneus ventricosus TaxID=182803 RepID=A0A4Y2KPJ4_ARAVE|nr:hypothetical protein AVEN_88936-1 [Araneus ventricosus]